MSAIDRLKSAEAVIGAVVALVAIAAKYAAVSQLLILPEGVAGIAPHLSTLAVIVLTLLAIFLSRKILRLPHGLIGMAIASMLVTGIFLAVRFKENVTEQSVEVLCSDDSAIVVEPTAPSERLAQLLIDGGGIENAWCEENRTLVRQLVARENAEQVTALIFLLIIAEASLVLALTLAGWLVANTQDQPPRKARRPRKTRPAPGSDPAASG